MYSSISLQEIHHSAVKSSITGWLAVRASPSAASSAATVSMARNVERCFFGRSRCEHAAGRAARHRALRNRLAADLSPPSVAPISSNAPYRQASTPMPFARRRAGASASPAADRTRRGSTPVRNTSSAQSTSVDGAGQHALHHVDGDAEHHDAEAGFDGVHPRPDLRQQLSGRGADEQQRRCPCRC